MRRSRFWITACLATLAFAAASAWLFPYAPLGLDTPAERERAWLLTLWTGGVMAICFGAAGLLSAVTPLGFRDVAEAGSLPAARDARREGYKTRSSGVYNFAGWTMTTGLGLLLIYFIAWLATGL